MPVSSRADGLAHKEPHYPVSEKPKRRNYISHLVLWLTQLEARKADDAAVERLVGAVPEHVGQEVQKTPRHRRFVTFDVTTPLRKR